MYVCIFYMRYIPNYKAYFRKKQFWSIFKALSFIHLWFRSLDKIIDDPWGLGVYNTLKLHVVNYSTNAA